MSHAQIFSENVAAFFNQKKALKMLEDDGEIAEYTSVRGSCIKMQIVKNLSRNQIILQTVHIDMEPCFIVSYWGQK